MRRTTWFLLAGLGVAIAFALARYAVPWLEAGRPELGQISVNESFVVLAEGPVTYDQGRTIQHPDQPGWRARVGHEFFGLSKVDFIVAARRSKMLGSPKGEGNVLTLPPFVLAALPWEDTTREEHYPPQVLSKVAQLLRAQKIVAYGNPMALTYPTPKARGEFWKDPDRRIWLGIPVPAGTVVEKPLVLKEFPGAEVVAVSSDFSAIDTAEDWQAVLAKAKAAGRETTLPMIHRFSGWISYPPRVRVQRMLPLKPLDAANPSSEARDLRP